MSERERAHFRKGTKCNTCGNALTDDERTHPIRHLIGQGPEWEAICEDCWSEREEFECCLCENKGDNEDQHFFLVVMDAEAAGLSAYRMRRCINGRRGIYRIDKWPYYADGMIEGHLMRDALTYIRPLPPELDMEAIEDWGYPCGHLCLECQRKLSLKRGNPAGDRRETA